MESETRCPECREAEMPTVRRMLNKARIVAFGYTAQEQFEMYGNAMSGFTAALTGRKGKTWYDRHKEEYERTGNADEFERMLRHVKKGE